MLRWKLAQFLLFIHILLAIRIINAKPTAKIFFILIHNHCAYTVIAMLGGVRCGRGCLK